MANSEQYCNDPGTTLSSPAASGDATIQVASSTGYPSTGNFRIRIDNELMLVTSISGTTWSVTRGIETTSAASHSNSANVNQVFTAGAMTTIRSNMSQYGTYVNVPSTSVAFQGDHYQTSDSVYRFLYDGSVFQPFLSSKALIIPPSAGSFTLANSPTLTGSGGTLLYTCVNSNAWSAAHIAVPGSLPYTLEVALMPLSLNGSGGSSATLAACCSDGTGFVYFYSQPGSSILVVQYNSTVNSFSSTLYDGGNFSAFPTFLKITFDSSHRTYYVGDGIDYQQVFQESISANLTATRAGIAMYDGNGSVRSMMKCIHFMLA
jgi:hypothetical protein